MSLVTTGPADASLEEQAYVSPAWPADSIRRRKPRRLRVAPATRRRRRGRWSTLYCAPTGRTSWVPTGPLGGNAVGTDLLSISGDGQTIAFATKEQLTDEDTDRKMDFYRRRASS